MQINISNDLVMECIHTSSNMLSFILIVTTFIRSFSSSSTGDPSPLLTISFSTLTKSSCEIDWSNLTTKLPVLGTSGAARITLRASVEMNCKQRIHSKDIKKKLAGFCIANSI